MTGYVELKISEVHGSYQKMFLDGHVSGCGRQENSKNGLYAFSKTIELIVINFCMTSRHIMI